MKKIFLLPVLIVGLLTITEAKNESKKTKSNIDLSPPDSEKPINTIPYNSSLCKNSNEEKVFGYVANDAKFNEKYEITPVKAMKYDPKKKIWVKINPKSVTCYEPSEGGV